MAITRRFEITAEINGTTFLSTGGEFDDVQSDGMSVRSDFNGSERCYAWFNAISASHDARVHITATRHFRFGCRLSHAGGGYSHNPDLISWCDAETPGNWVGRIRLKDGAGSNQLELLVDNAVVATSAAGSFAANTVYHFGVEVYVHNTTGYVSVYIDGAPIIQYSGAHTGNEDILMISLGDHSANDWAAWLRIRDGYCDDMTGESGPNPCPLVKFINTEVNADGDELEWDCSAGTDHYALVDDVPKNDDTDYLEATSAGLGDRLSKPAVTIPAGYHPTAVLPYAFAKRTDPGTGSQVKVGLTLSGVDSMAAARDLSSSYAMIRERFTTKPGGGSWADADVDNAILRIESAGSF